MTIMNPLKYSDIKEFWWLDEDHWRNVVENVSTGKMDFEIGDYRYISTKMIDQIQQDELSGDEYTIGCFHSWFLADVLNIDDDVIDAMQKAEAFEAIGKLVLSLGKLGDLQKEYARQDGYGHHFAHYDFEEHELPAEYLGFKIN